MIGQGVNRARVQSLEPAVLLDELEAAVALLTTSINEGVSGVRWAARLKAFRELRAEAARLRVEIGDLVKLVIPESHHAAALAEPLSWQVEQVRSWLYQSRSEAARLRVQLAASREAAVLREEVAEDDHVFVRAKDTPLMKGARAPDWPLAGGNADV
ncbi:MAG: hypothetical protein WC205_04160 [Opitutaceae bacterium]|jgi:hypothetical protein